MILHRVNSKNLLKTFKIRQIHMHVKTKSQIHMHVKTKTTVLVLQFNFVKGVRVPQI